MLTAAVVLAGMANVVSAQDAKAKAREVVKKNAESVVWVTAVVKVEITGGGRSLGNPESKVQALGTVIDPTGLTVVAFSAIDPGAAVNGRSMNVGGENVKLSAKSEHSQVKIVVGDQEYASRIVMSDPDLDLAFVLPDKGEKKMTVPPLKLEKAPKLEVLDELVCLGRLPKVLSQEPAAAMSEVSAVVKKPRTFILGGRTLGGPVLTLDGAVVGITASYKTDPANPAGSTMVIVPAEDVMEIAKQALLKKDEPASSETTTKPAASKNADDVKKAD